MILFAINETNIFYILKQFIFNSEYRNNFTLAESNIKENISIIEVVKRTFLEFDWAYDYMLIWGTNIFQVLIPCLSAISGLLFFNKLETIYKISFHRSKEKNIFKFLSKEASNDSLKLASSIFIAFFIFSIICLIISNCITNVNEPRELFLDILGDNFYFNHTYLYYLLEGFVKFFVIPYIYSMLSCSLSLISKNKKQAFFSTLIYYFGLTMFSLALQLIIGNIAIYINPTTIMVSGSYEYINTIVLLLFTTVPLIISYIIMYRKSINVEI